MSAWIYRLGAFFASLPVSNLLIFALLIWMVFFLILSANPKNKLNQWCFTAGMIFSVGCIQGIPVLCALPRFDCAAACSRRKSAN